MAADRAQPHGRARLGWWVALGVITLAGLVARCWGLDYDSRQHQHPDERFWAMVADGLGQADESTAGRGTLVGPLLDWLDADSSPVNAYRATESFVYGPLPLTLSRGVAGWMRDGVDHDRQPAEAVVRGLDAIGIPLLDDDGLPRFDDRYQVDLVGRLVGAVLDTVAIVVVGILGRRVGRLVGGGPPVGLVAAALYAACPLVIQHAHVMGSEPMLALTTALTVLAAVGADRSASVRRARWHGALIGMAGGAVTATKLSGAGVLLVPAVATAWLAWRHRRAADVVRLVALGVAAAVTFRILHPGAFDGLGLGLSDAFRDDIDRVRNQYAADVPPSIQWAGRSGTGGFVTGALWLVRFTYGPGLCIAALVGGATACWRLRRGTLPGGRWPVAIVGGAALVPAGIVFATAVPSGRYFVPALPAMCALAGLGVVAAWNAAAGLGVRRRALVRTGAVALVAINVLWGVMFVRGIYATPYTRTEASEWIAANIPPGSVITSEAWDDGLPLAVPGVDPAQFQSEQLNLVGTDSVEKLTTLVAQLQRVDYVVESSPRLWGTVGRIPARFPSTIRFFEGLDSGVLGFERVATFDREPMLGPLRLDDSTADEQYSVFDHPEVRIWQKVADVGPGEMIDVLDPVAAGRALTVTASTAGSGGLLLTDREAADLIVGPTWDDEFVGGPSWLHAVGWVVLFELLALASFALLFPVFRRLPDLGWGIAKPLGLLGPAVLLFVANTWFRVGLGRAVAAAAVAVFLAAGALAGWRRRAAIRGALERGWRVVMAVEAAALAAVGGVLALRAANPDQWHPYRSGEKPFELTLLTATLRSEHMPPYDPWFSGGVLNYYYGGYLMLTAPARLLGTAPAVVMNVGIAVFAGAAIAAAGSAGALLARRGCGRGGPIAGALAAMFTFVAANLAVGRAAWQHWRSGAPFDWWSVSRVAPGTTDITEFPGWSFLFADLHPHVMALGLVLAGLVAAAALHDALRDGSAAAVVWLAALCGVIAGGLRATNTWDFPLAVAVPLAAVAASARLPGRGRRAVAALAVFAIALALPWRAYVARGQVFDSGVVRARIHTPFDSWLWQFGLFAAATLLVTAPDLWAAARRSPRIGRWDVPAAAVRGVGIALVATGSLLVWRWSGVAVGAALLALAAGWAAWQWRAEPGRARAALALAVGWSIQAGVELVTLVNDIGRQNTVFKFWFQSWLLLGIGSAALVLRLCVGSGQGRAARVRRRAAWTLSTATVALAAVFWALAVPERSNDRVSGGGWTLDGERYLTDPTAAATTTYRDAAIRPADDLELVSWLRSNVAGAPVVAEAPGDDYAWTSRLTWLTGLPTPTGWRFHQVQQRRGWGDAVDRRFSDMTTLYQTPDPAEVARVLATYDVAYVVVGTVERVIATPNSALSTSPCVEAVFESGDDLIARVDQDCAYRAWREALIAQVNRAG